MIRIILSRTCFQCGNTVLACANEARSSLPRVVKLGTSTRHIVRRRSDAVPPGERTWRRVREPVHGRRLLSHDESRVAQWAGLHAAAVAAVAGGSLAA